MDLLNTEQEYCMSRTVKENFGGDSRFKTAVKALNIPVIETKQVYTGTGTQKITGVSKLDILDSVEFINEMMEWYNNKKA